MRTKAQSQIITTILLILIVLAAVIVVWIVIQRFLDVPTADCSEVRMAIEKVDTTANTVVVKRQPGGTGVTVTDVKVGAGGAAVDLGAGLKELETATVSIAVASGDIVEVAAVVTNTNGEATTCPVTDRVKVS